MLAQLSTELLIILVLTLANGFFAAAEIAIVSARRSRLEALAKEGSSAAQQALVLTTNPNLFLATVQVGITLISTFSAAFGGARIGDVLAVQLRTIPAVEPYAETISLVIVVVLITYISLVLGELVPKRLALQNAERLATFAAPIMAIVSMVTRPLVSILTGSVNLVFMLLRQKESGDVPVTAEDIMYMLREGSEAGTVTADDAEMIERVFRSSDRPVRTVMTPRTAFVAVDVQTSLHEAAERFVASGYSRLPIYEDSPDHILGMLHAKDLLPSLIHGTQADLRPMVRPAPFVVDSAHVGEVLTSLKQKGTHLAFVLDEYGQIAGLVTMEDLLEEVVGEIRDEYDEEESPAFVQREDGSWLVDAAESFDKVKAHIGLPSLEDESGFTTLAGMVLSELNRVPSVGDSVKSGSFIVEVVDMDGRRIDKVLIRQIETDPNPE
jgi:putative hemolysin